MNTGKTFLEYTHPIDGLMSFSAAGDLIRFSCRWPFDLHTDEWIDITNEFDARVYAREVGQLPAKGTVRVKGTRTGHMELTILAEKKVKLDVEDNCNERPPRLVYTLDLLPGDLLPDRDDSSCPLRRSPRPVSGRANSPATR
jgi:hypothetical protein